MEGLASVFVHIDTPVVPPVVVSWAKEWFRVEVIKVDVPWGRGCCKVFRVSDGMDGLLGLVGDVEVNVDVLFAAVVVCEPAVLCFFYERSRGLGPVCPLLLGVYVVVVGDNLVVYLVKVPVGKSGSVVV